MNEQEELYERIAETEGNSAEQAETGASKRKLTRGRAVAIVSALSILVCVFCIAYFGFGGSGGVAGTRSANNVEVIDISGTITTSGDTYNQAFVEKRISTAQNDPNNAAIMLLVNSTGGAVYESDETYLKLKEYKEETGRPVYAYCQKYCASGAYYISAAADEIIANRNSMVGSIGVICGQFVDATALLEKLGIDVTTVHSGANKLMGNYYVSPTEEQIAIYQELSDEIYDRFVDIVATSRSLSDSEVRALADGRIYSASQSKDNGLIDSIMTEDECDDHMRELLGDDITFYHEKYKKDKTSVIWDFLKDALGSIRAGSDEVGAALEAVENLSYEEPMLIYKP